MTEASPLRVILVGTGRLATALAHRWALYEGPATAVHVAAVVGRDRSKAQALVDGLPGDVAVLSLEAVAGGDAWPDGHCVVLAVDDRGIPDVVAGLAPLAVPGQVWCHTAGGVGLGVLEPLLAKGALTGVFHPARPVPAADHAGIASFSGLNDQDGRALICDDTVSANRPDEAPGGLVVLAALALAAGLTPISVDEVPDPTLYHAGCAMAANGATALAVAAGEAIRSGAGLSDEDAAEVIASLLTGAAAAIRAHPKGWRSGAALSGPAVRGDVDALQRHLDVLHAMPGDLGPAAVRGYRATMVIAAELAHQRGTLSGAALARLQHDLLGEL